MGVVSEWDKMADTELLGTTQSNAKDYTDTQVSSLSGVMDEINAKIDEVKAITEQAKTAADAAKNAISTVDLRANKAKILYNMVPIPFSAAKHIVRADTSWYEFINMNNIIFETHSAQIVSQVKVPEIEFELNVPEYGGNYSNSSSIIATFRVELFNIHGGTAMNEDFDVAIITDSNHTNKRLYTLKVPNGIPIEKIVIRARISMWPNSGYKVDDATLIVRVNNMTGVYQVG